MGLMEGIGGQQVRVLFVKGEIFSTAEIPRQQIKVLAMQVQS